MATDPARGADERLILALTLPKLVSESEGECLDVYRHLLASLLVESPESSEVKPSRYPRQNEPL